MRRFRGRKGQAEPRWTQDELRSVPLQKLMDIVSTATEPELRIIINSRINVLVQQAALDRLESMATQEASRGNRFRSWLAIGVSAAALLIAFLSWIGFRP